MTVHFKHPSRLPWKASGSPGRRSAWATCQTFLFDFSRVSEPNGSVQAEKGVGGYSQGIGVWSTLGQRRNRRHPILPTSKIAVGGGVKYREDVSRDSQGSRGR